MQNEHRNQPIDVRTKKNQTKQNYFTKLQAIWLQINADTKFPKISCISFGIPDVCSNQIYWSLVLLHIQSLKVLKNFTKSNRFFSLRCNANRIAKPLQTTNIWTNFVFEMNFRLFFNSEWCFIYLSRSFSFSLSLSTWACPCVCVRMRCMFT